MAKKKSNNKSTSKKRTYRRKPTRPSALKLFSLLVVITIISVAGLFYLRSAFVAKDDIEAKSLELNKKIANIDSSLKEHLFNQGISSEDIKFTVIKKSEDGLVWNFKEGKARLKSPGYSEISNELKKISRLDNITLNIKEKSNMLKAEVFAFGYMTHSLDFLPVLENKSAKKPKKSETIDNNEKHRDKAEVEYSQKLKAEKNRPKIVIIVDDVGQKKDAVDKLVKIKFPINFAVLPHLPYSEYAARSAYENGKEVLLHLPMEPKYSSGYTAEDAGKGALLVGHSKDQIESELARNLDSIPHIMGVNNHMGSKFTENKELMELVLREIKDRKLYFVDSLTSNRSYGKSLSDQMGIKFAKRDVFLDDSKKGKHYMIDQLNSLVRIAEKNGVAVGICHTYPESIEVLSEYLPKINGRVEISSVTSIFD